MFYSRIKCFIRELNVLFGNWIVVFANKMLYSRIKFYIRELNSFIRELNGLFAN